MSVSVLESQAAAMPVGHQFSPYTSNGGSILAIHGEDYCVIAGDTRQSEGYNIQTRYKPKVFRLCVAFLTTGPTKRRLRLTGLLRMQKHL